MIHLHRLARSTMFWRIMFFLMAALFIWCPRTNTVVVEEKVFIVITPEAYARTI